MIDKVEKLRNSLVHHGTLNKRIYLLRLAPKDMYYLPDQLEELATEKKYTKIIAKVPLWAEMAFTEAGYCKEAFIPNFYNGKTGVYFMSKFLLTERRIVKSPKQDLAKDILRRAKKASAKEVTLPEEMQMRPLDQSDAPALSELYKSVFDVYPFPIFEPDYIIETMESHIRYFGVFSDENLIAASSSEMEKNGQNVEMTDFATHPDAAGNSLALLLLKRMEKEMQETGMKTAFTIARSYSPGMNITFGRSGYEYGGTLVNNTKIYSGIESMNIWYKRL